MEEIKSKIKELHKQCVHTYDNTKQILNKGDIVWTFIDGECKQVKVDEVQYFDSEGSYIFYWVVNPDIKWYDMLIQIIRYCWWLYVGRRFGKLQYINPKFGFGHAVLVGRGNDLFFSKEQCELDYLFNWLWNDILDIQYILEQGEENE